MTRTLVTFLIAGLIYDCTRAMQACVYLMSRSLNRSFFNVIHTSWAVASKETSNSSKTASKEVNSQCHHTISQKQSSSKVPGILSYFIEQLNRLQWKTFMKKKLELMNIRAKVQSLLLHRISIIAARCSWTFHEVIDLTYCPKKLPLRCFLPSLKLRLNSRGE